MIRFVVPFGFSIQTSILPTFVAFVCCTALATNRHFWIFVSKFVIQGKRILLVCWEVRVLFSSYMFNSSISFHDYGPLVMKKPKLNYNDQGAYYRDISIRIWLTLNDQYKLNNIYTTNVLLCIVSLLLMVLYRASIKNPFSFTSFIFVSSVSSCEKDMKRSECSISKVAKSLLERRFQTTP